MKNDSIIFVNNEYLTENGYDKFIQFLTQNYRNNINEISVSQFIKANIEYYKQTGWNKFISLSGLINFVGGVDAVVEIAKEDFGYSIVFLKNEANIKGYVFEDNLSINEVKYIKL